MKNHPLKIYLLLSAETKLFDDISVSLDVIFLEIVQKLTSFTYETQKGTAGDIVLFVLLHVLREVSDTVGE